VLRNTTGGDALLCLECLSIPEGFNSVSLDERESNIFEVSGFPLTESTMMCGGDGKHLFFVESSALFVCEPRVRKSSRSNKVTFDLEVIQSVPLAAPRSNGRLVDLFPLNPASWNVICNGHFVCAVCSDLTDDDIAFATITWDAQSGAIVETQDAVLTKIMLGRTCCYDAETNLVRALPP
jgi:hypothetical protein